MSASHTSLLKSLAGQTVVYGLSTVLARLLNWALVPFHTEVFDNQADYGVVSELYAWVTFLNVIFIYGMETAFFRFAKKGLQANRAFGTAFGSLLITTSVGLSLLLVNAGAIARGLQLDPNMGPQFVKWFALIIALDTLSAIPFARLRLQGKPWLYAAIKLTNVGINIGLNVFFLYPLYAGDATIFQSWGYTYNPAIGAGYVFLANLVASAVTFIVFFPSLFRLRLGISTDLWKEMFLYGAPFIVVGLAGMVNEIVDRILLGRLLEGTVEENRAVVGIYSAAYKLSIFMTMTVQAFRMGAEPFFFSTADRGDAAQIYAQMSRSLLVLCLLVFMGVSIFLLPVSLILGDGYREAIYIVPILLMANLFLGLFYSLSVWYKVKDKTLMAAYIATGGAALTLLLNFVGIPIFGYWASAWATLIVYLSMTVASYILSRRYFPIPYKVPRMLLLIAFSSLYYFIFYRIETQTEQASMNAIRVVSFLIFAGILFWAEIRPLLKSLRTSS
jgi:O-antigen/teichoic acid export membrane protein